MLPALQLRTQAGPPPLITGLSKGPARKPPSFWLPGQSIVVRPGVMEAILLSPPIHPYFWIWVILIEKVMWEGRVTGPDLREKESTAHPPV